MLKKIKSISGVAELSKKLQSTILGGREPQCQEGYEQFDCGCAQCWYCDDNVCQRVEFCNC